MLCSCPIPSKLRSWWRLIFWFYILQAFASKLSWLDKKTGEVPTVLASLYFTSICCIALHPVLPPNTTNLWSNITGHILHITGVPILTQLSSSKPLLLTHQIWKLALSSMTWRIPHRISFFIKWVLHGTCGLLVPCFLLLYRGRSDFSHGPWTERAWPVHCFQGQQGYLFLHVCVWPAQLEL